MAAPCIRWVLLAVAAVALVLLAAVLKFESKNPTPPRYYASVLSVSRSRVDSNDLDIGISLGVEQRSPLWGRACLDRGTQVAVAYQGVPLASNATGDDLCTSWWDLWSVQGTTVVARGSKVGGFADAARQVGAFDVTFRIRSDCDHDGKLVTCVAWNSLFPATACDVHY
jgi:hypothetical protein